MSERDSPAEQPVNDEEESSIAGGSDASTASEETGAASEEDGTATSPATPAANASKSRLQLFLSELMTGSFTLTFLSIVLAFVVGAVLIIVSNPDVQDTFGYIFARPSDFFIVSGEVIAEAYQAMFEGAIYNFGEGIGGFASLGDTLTFSVPLIAAGLGVALAFQTGMFNIGAEGQIILGAIFAVWVGFALELPPVVHMLVGVLAGLVGGALWGGIVGVLKARTGAHEVIVTIMLNYVARFLVTFLLTTPLLQRPGGNEPESPSVKPTAELPTLFGDATPLHLGFVFVVLAAFGVWWLLRRSTLGFELRTAGANPNAARTAGMSVNRSYAVVMLLAGALAGLAGVAQVLGTERYLTASVSSGLGFDAITVALLGRASPWGTVAAGILFGALRAGGVQMQASTGTPIDVITIIQALVVLFIAAPPLIRAIFGLRVSERGGPVAAMAKGWS